MSSWLLTLGLVIGVGMLVGCATPYGETEPAEVTAAVTSDRTEPKKKSAHVEDSSKVSEANDTSEANDPSTTSGSAATPTASPTKTTVTAAPASVSFSWNRVNEKAEYSLDLLLKDRTTVGPCIGVTWIHQDLSTTFRGNCPSSEASPSVAMSDIDGFQLCWAEDDDWKHATCTHVVWDGTSSTVTFDTSAP